MRPPQCLNCGLEPPSDASSCPGCGRNRGWIPPMFEHLFGQVLDDRWRVRRAIADLEDGWAFDAEDPATEQRAMVLALSPYIDDARKAAHFRRFLGVARSIRHRNVAQIIGDGFSERSSEGGSVRVSHIVTEFIGEPFSYERARVGRFPLERVVDVALQVLDGLQAIHAQGLVHGSIGIDPLFVTSTEGLDRIRMLPCSFTSNLECCGAGWDLELTRAIPPLHVLERETDGSFDARTDTFHVGTLLYELVTGRDAYEGSTIYALLVQRMQAGDADPRAVVADLPAEFASVVMRSRARDPADRFQTAADMAAALRGSVGREIRSDV